MMNVERYSNISNCILFDLCTAYISDDYNSYRRLYSAYCINIQSTIMAELQDESDSYTTDKNEII